LTLPVHYVAVGATLEQLKSQADMAALAQRTVRAWDVDGRRSRWVSSVWPSTRLRANAFEKQARSSLL